MPMNSAFDTEFTALLEGLTERQVNFLIVRKDVETDTEVLELPGQPSRRTLYNWREKSPEFARAHDLASDRTFEKNALIKLDDDQRSMMRSEVYDNALKGLGPGLVRLLNTAANAAKDADATSAFKVVMQLLRLDEVGLNPMTRQNQAMVEMMQLLQGRVMYELETKGVDLRELKVLLIM